MIRDICGTDSGYRKHRRMGEEKCQPCRDAHNIQRRATYDPDKNRQYANAHRSKPEVQNKIKAYHKEYRKPSQEVLDARLRKHQEVIGEELTKGIDYRLSIEDNRLFKKEKKELNQRAKILKESIFSTTTPILTIFSNKRKDAKAKDKASIKREARQEDLERKRLIRRFIKAANRYARYQERLNSIIHGLDINNYSKCKKMYKNACDPCKAAAAAYRKEQVAKDPEKYKQQKKESIKRVGRPTKSRDRARKRGVKTEYYTRKHIFDRDGYNCYLCNEPVDLEATHVQGQPGWERYPHIEHVIPLAKGGEDTLDNVKIAHAKCNMDKGVKVLYTTAQTDLH